VNRDEAVLRELNLYPLWVRRDAAPAVRVGEPVVVAPVAEPVVVAPVLEPASVAELRVAPPAAAVPAAEMVRDTVEALGWPELKARVQGCTACALRAGCKQTVFGVGDEHADWLFVGEGPGAEEDERGEPFVGQAGQLLDNMLLAIKLQRGKSVYIGNVVKCRPPGNRTPEAAEIAQCLPYLQRQIQLIQPRVIVALGKTAATALLRMGDAEGIGSPSASPLRGLGKEATLASLRGTVHDYRGIPLIITYHPAYLLRTPADKAKAWQDLCLAVKTMQEQGNVE
jgi:uracil-DNA glycosylase family 4